MPSVESLSDYVSDWSNGLTQLDITSTSTGEDIVNTLRGIKDIEFPEFDADNLVESYNALKDVLDSIGLGFRTDEVFDAWANSIEGFETPEDWEGRSASE